MKKIIIAGIIALLAMPAAYAGVNPLAVLETNLGNIVIELYPDAAPKTVENFINYAKDKTYDNTIFHRVIRGFMIQGGGLTSDMKKKPVKAPVINEADNGLKNLRYSVAMARTNAPHSATSQFFINTKDNTFLDHKAKKSGKWGYCVFGKVVKGVEIVDRIESVDTGIRSFRKDVPRTPVIIKTIIIKEGN